MKLYEFQSKEILQRYGIPVPRGKVISESSNASGIFKEIDGNRCVIKAQIHAGNRGKSGGIRFVNTPSEARKCAEDLLGARITTRQTDQKGVEIKYLLIEEAISVKSEFYLAMTIDRSLYSPALIVSAEGGMDIEEVAQKTPGKIIKEPVDICFGILPFQLRRITHALNIHGTLSSGLHNLIANLCNAFLINDCSLLEINPLAVTESDEIYALDAKIDIDDNSLYRHTESEPYASHQASSPAEALAMEYRLNYISLDGNIGCLVNGAGLAMATMDIIKFYGGEPANFLDVGGDATLEQVVHAFRIIVSDPGVNVVFINIFGGIMKCDTVASGIIQIIKETDPRIPFVVRLEGTNADGARKLLKESGLNILSTSDMKDAASTAVRAAKQRKRVGELEG
ncbi:MAG: ADP-forming succinate--CoA ligase subunit beta [Candidatus Loosdrechtia sp.]|uniref:succinate--CoA ligase subunit beta n=1 Tax=Candidatus Loosdrechtia sp. TaxID=3101272 RepID=UPI003A67A73C|nr:MAG: ADP-forming succinate--CoA ligase subunit beta [Candidatus Jettenia sp. AMX2]